MIDASGPASEVVIRHHPSNDGARSGTDSSSSRTSANFASVKSRSRRVASPSENGPGMPGGGTGWPSCSLSTSSTRPSHGLRSRSAQTATAARPPGLVTRAISVTAPRGIERELHAVTAVDDVERRVGLSDVFDVEAAAVHVGEAGAVGTRDRDVDHLDCHVRRDDLARIDQPATASVTAPGPHASSRTRSPAVGAVAATSHSVIA